MSSCWIDIPSRLAFVATTVKPAKFDRSGVLDYARRTPALLPIVVVLGLVLLWMSSKSGSPVRLVAVIGLLVLGAQYYMGPDSFLHGVWRALIELPATAFGNLR